jgi:hypothetical protein
VTERVSSLYCFYMLTANSVAVRFVVTVVNILFVMAFVLLHT